MKETNRNETESPSEWKIRTRLGLDRWAPAVAMLLVVVALAGGWMTYAAYAVEEEPEVKEVVASEWSTSPGFRHSATVERPNPLYEIDEEVSNKPVYYTSITPSLNGMYRFEYTATEGGNLDIVTDIRMVLRETDGSGAVYWSQTESIVRKEKTDVEPQQPVRTEFTVDVPSVRQRMESIKSGLGANMGNEEVVLVLTTRMQGEINGESANFAEEHRVRVSIAENTYTVETGEEGMQGRSFETTENVEVEPEPDNTRMVISPILLLVSLGLLFGLVVAKRKDVIMPTERQLLTMERREFNEWISTGSLSDDVLQDGRRSFVLVDSIEGIVDIAIDCGRRVIEDRDESLLAVIDEDVVYVYEYEEDIWKPPEDFAVQEEDETEDGEITVADEDDVKTVGEMELMSEEELDESVTVGQEDETDSETKTTEQTNGEGDETTEAEQENGENGETEDADKQDDGIDIFERLKRSDD